MKTLTANTAYGYQELRNVQQRNMMLALLVSVAIQMMIIGSYHLSGLLKPIEPPVKHFPVERTIFLPPPLNPTLPNPNIGGMLGKFTGGIPVPVPDCEVKPDMPDYAGQPVLSQKANDFWTQIGDLSGNADIKIDDSDPLPGIYVPREFSPEIILRTIPEYPDVAQRISLEGSVIVNVLIDKDGKVKKALIVKKSDDIFVEPALAAAYKWVFKPALMQGKPVAVWMAIPFRFSLTKM